MLYLSRPQVAKRQKAKHHGKHTHTTVRCSIYILLHARDGWAWPPFPTEDQSMTRDRVDYLKYPRYLKYKANAESSATEDARLLSGLLRSVLHYWMMFLLRYLRKSIL